MPRAPRPAAAFPMPGGAFPMPGSVNPPPASQPAPQAPMGVEGEEGEAPQIPGKHYD